MTTAEQRVEVAFKAALGNPLRTGLADLLAGLRSAHCPEGTARRLEVALFNVQLEALIAHFELELTRLP